MRHALALLACLLLIPVPEPTRAQNTGVYTADEVGAILQRALRHREDRTEGVDQFMTQTTFMSPMLEFGESGGLLQEKVWCRDDQGRLSHVWRTVPAEEVQVRSSQGELPSSGILREAGRKSVEAGEMVNEGLEREGVPVGLIASLNPEPWGGSDGFNMLNPGDYFAGYALFFNVTADAVDAARSAGTPAQQACQAAARRDVTLADNVELVGQEPIHGRNAHVIRVAGLDQTQPAGEGVDFTLQTASMWVDTEHYVPLLTRFEGVATQDGQSRPVTIEKEELDYRTVPGSDMYESYRQVLRIQGFTELGPEAEQAQREMAELEQQLAEMPPDQRAMVERMMGDKLETVRQMAAGEGIEVEVVVDTIIVNPGIPRIEGGPKPLETVALETAPVLPLYVDGEGVGVLRYTPPGAAEGEYFIDIKQLTADSPDFGETLVRGLGPYKGPVIAVYVDDLSGLGVPFDQLELELYQTDPRRAAARFRPEIDPARAESLEDCGTVSGTGACSNTGPSS